VLLAWLKLVAPQGQTHGETRGITAMTETQEPSPQTVGETLEIVGLELPTELIDGVQLVAVMAQAGKLIDGELHATMTAQHRAPTHGEIHDSVMVLYAALTHGERLGATDDYPRSRTRIT